MTYAETQIALHREPCAKPLVVAQNQPKQFDDVAVLRASLVAIQRKHGGFPAGLTYCGRAKSFFDCIRQHADTYQLWYSYNKSGCTGTSTFITIQKSEVVK